MRGEGCQEKNWGQKHPKIGLSKIGVQVNVHFHVAQVQPPSNTMAAANDGTTVPLAHRPHSAP